MTKAGLTDFLSAGALTSEEKSPTAGTVGQNILNTERNPPPPLPSLLPPPHAQALRRLGGSGLVALL